MININKFCLKIATVLENITIMNYFLRCEVIGEDTEEEIGLMETSRKRCHFSIT